MKYIPYEYFDNKLIQTMYMKLAVQRYIVITVSSTAIYSCQWSNTAVDYLQQYNFVTARNTLQGTLQLGIIP